MVKLTKAQRKALWKVFQRDFPTWLSPTTRLEHKTDIRPWEFSVGQTHVKIEEVTLAGEVVGMVAVIPLTCPRAKFIAEEVCYAHNRHRPQTIKVPSTQWRHFRLMVFSGPGCVLVSWRGMWLGIEPDGYTHS